MDGDRARTRVVLPRDVRDIADHTVDGRMEAVVVGGGEAEDGQAGVVEGFRLLRVGSHTQEVGDGEVAAFHPVARSGI